jgi:YVTN family beta-propeller protein
VGIPGPRTIAITPDGKTAYVVNEGAGTVVPINTATNTRGAPIAAGQSPDRIAIA